jgi:glycosyltransferase involved in cell wall biosynthesis
MNKAAFIMSIYRKDRADWLRQALESMRNQTVPANIYLCADGPLSPELDACLDEVEPVIHRLIRFPENRGLACALNAMIDALGDEEFVLRLDADDICLPDRVETQTAFLEQHPEVLLCGSSIQEFRDTPQQTGLLRTYPADTPAMKKYILKANPFAHSTVCFRRAFFERVGVYNEAFPLRQDIELWFRAVALDVPMANLRAPVLLFRVSDELVLRRNLPVGLVELRIFMKGIYRLKGIHPAMIWPLLRLAVRILPAPVTGWIYRRSARKMLNV